MSGSSAESRSSAAEICAEICWGRTRCHMYERTLALTLVM
jgi:hypothetical protein